MKKFVKSSLILFVSAFCALTMVACGNSKNNDVSSETENVKQEATVSSELNNEATQETSVQETATQETTTTQETTENVTQETTTSSTNSDKLFDNLNDYLEAPEIKSSLDAIKDSFSDTLEINFYAEGETLVYEYKYKEQISDDILSSTKQILDETLQSESMQSLFKPVLQEIVNNVNVENPAVKFVYTNADGSVISERTVDKSILDE